MIKNKFIKIFLFTKIYSMSDENLKIGVLSVSQNRTTGINTFGNLL